jgi:hypothetical protein
MLKRQDAPFMVCEHALAAIGFAVAKSLVPGQQRSRIDLQPDADGVGAGGCPPAHLSERIVRVQYLDFRLHLGFLAAEISAPGIRPA